MPRTRAKIFAKQREREPLDHLGRPLSTFKEVTEQIVEDVNKIKPENKEEKK